MDNISLIHEIKSRLREADLYEQLAEEAAELSQAALKMSRSLRKRNPPEASRPEIMANINEEIKDIGTVLCVLNGRDDYFNLNPEKLRRWYNRLEGYFSE